MFKEIFQEGVSVWSSSSNVVLGELESGVEMYKVETNGRSKTECPKCLKDLHLDMNSGRLTAAHCNLTTLPYHVVDNHWQWVVTLDLSNNRIE